MKGTALVYAGWLVAAVLLASCAEQQRNYTSPTDYPSPESQTKHTKQLQIISDPPGARIEINEDYIGDAPLTVTIPCDEDGQFKQPTTIRALPTQPGHYVQRKDFPGGGLVSWSGDRVPSRVFFDTRLGPVSPDINVNVNE